ncbi:hypothetical protein BIY27_11570 [Gibbsiella quercinecans]|uniref:hypothetical protein n=1 Tax=Gibbsiella quercinecans TaxID=929813 RepID=UPI000EF1CC20|nr:hypothetical protein [Gibbsiella quercinecans]RLM12592.1 hypothetical protein BIY27_11570 [Gibbsiella quercinecans]
MSHEIANANGIEIPPNPHDLIANVATMLLPDLSGAIQQAVERAVAIHTSPTMSKEDFAAVNGISASVLEKWIANGVVLLAPTPTTTVTQNRRNRKTGEVEEITMTKHGNALINLEAWREKNRQAAIKCRYIRG